MFSALHTHTLKQPISRLYGNRARNKEALLGAANTYLVWISHSNSGGRAHSKVKREHVKFYDCAACESL